MNTPRDKFTAARKRFPGLGSCICFSFTARNYYWPAVCLLSTRVSMYVMCWFALVTDNQSLTCYLLFPEHPEMIPSSWSFVAPVVRGYGVPDTIAAVGFIYCVAK